MQDLEQKLDGMYQFLSKSYHGNWQYRWSQTPYMLNHMQTGKNESIAGHQWACMGMWLCLRRICTHLSMLVDSAEIYERIWSHDLGETFLGDVSQFRQVNGEGVDKNFLERAEVEKMGEKLSKEILNQILSWLDEFETKPADMENLPVMVAKLIDTLQGNHFAMVFGQNLKEHSEVISKIVNRTFTLIAQRLLEYLKTHGHAEAYEEVLTIAKSHVKNIRQSGIDLELTEEFYL